MILTTEGVEHGSFAGLLSGENAESIDVGTDFIFTDLDNGGRDVVIEFTYKNNDDFIFGLAAFNTGQEDQNIPLINLVRRDEWNKLYLNITNIILNNPSEGYRLYFALDAADSSSKVFIDNVKLLHIP